MKVAIIVSSCRLRAWPVRFPLPFNQRDHGKRRGAGMGNDTVARVSTVDMKNDGGSRLQPSRRRFRVTVRAKKIGDQQSLAAHTIACW
jgi:hypothetical protein